MNRQQKHHHTSVGNVNGNVAIGDNNEQNNVTTADSVAAPPPHQEIKVLFLAANPVGTSQLKLDEEARNIKAKIRSAEFRDSMDFVTRWATRPDDLQQELLEQKPQIVHFSGHGTHTDGIVLVDDQGSPKAVSQEALRHLFSIFKDDVQLVVLNACHSATHAEAITAHIDCAVGMNQAIGDDAAIAFAGSLYRALGFGKSIREAFELAKVTLLLEGISEEKTPLLLTRRGIDPSAVKLLRG